MTHTVTVYGQPRCQQCRMTTLFLDREEIEYEYVDVSSDDEGREMVQFLGYSALPVVVADDMHWSGFRLKKLDYLVNALRNLSGDDENFDDAATAYLMGN